MAKVEGKITEVVEERAGFWVSWEAGEPLKAEGKIWTSGLGHIWNAIEGEMQRAANYRNGRYLIGEWKEVEIAL